MTRYQVLRRLECDPLSAAMISALNWMWGVRPGLIGFMHVTIEYDPEEEPKK